jgi:phosphoenolpyruvate---glycerone phosphotransferase subunit DhaM
MTEPGRVGLVLVSHSALLARGVAELAGEMAPDVRLIPAGGMPDGGLGTDFDTVSAAVEQADQGAGVVLFYDLGSAKLIADMIVESLNDPHRGLVIDAPIVEGAVAAAVAAQGGASLAEVAAAAVRGAATEPADGPATGASATEQAGAPPTIGSAELSVGGSAGMAAAAEPAEMRDTAPAEATASGAAEPSAGGGTEPSAGGAAGTGSSAGGTAAGAAVATSTGGAPGAELGGAAAAESAEVLLTNAIGLHARPAALLARAVAGLDAAVTVAFGGKRAEAGSILAVMALGARGGDTVTITATGPQAAEAVSRVRALAERDFDE